MASKQRRAPGPAPGAWDAVPAVIIKAGRVSNTLALENAFAWHGHLAATNSSSYFNNCLTKVSFGQVASHFVFKSLAASTADSD